MTFPIDHALCSELLGPYLRGELDEARRAALEAHLQSCNECAVEQAGLQALLAPAGAPLSRLERVRLRRAVAGRVTPNRPLTARLYPALGAAAALLVLFTAGYLTVRGDEHDDLAGRAQQSAPTAPEPLEAGEDAAERGAEQTVGAQVEAAPGPLFLGDLGDLTPAGLDELGQRDPFPAFASAFRAPVAERQRQDFADRLVRAWADPAARACIATLLTEEPSALPALGAGARLDGRPVLIVGAAQAAGDAGALSHYVIVAYDPTDCSRLATAAGSIPS